MAFPYRGPGWIAHLFPGCVRERFRFRRPRPHCGFPHRGASGLRSRFYFSCVRAAGMCFAHGKMQVADFRRGVLHSRCRRAIGAEVRGISFAPAFIGMRARVRGRMPQKFPRPALHESRAICREHKKSVQIWNLDGFSQTIKKEAWVGIEPTHKAFAEPRLTTWLPRRKLKFHTKSEKNPPGKKNF